MQTKTCPRCNEELPEAHFCKDRQTASGLSCYCRKCQTLKARIYKHNPLYAAKIKRKSYEYSQLPDVKKRALASQAKYRSKDHIRESRQRKHREWCNSESGRAYLKEYRKKMRFQSRAHDAVKYAIRTGTLLRPSSCSKCGRACIPEGHHHKGYEREYHLDVQWLCSKCHRGLTVIVNRRKGFGSHSQVSVKISAPAGIL